MLKWSHIIAAIFKSVFGLFGFLTFGELTQNEISNSLPNQAFKVINIFRHHSFTTWGIWNVGEPPPPVPLIILKIIQCRCAFKVMKFAAGQFRYGKLEPHTAAINFNHFRFRFDLHISYSFCFPKNLRVFGYKRELFDFHWKPSLNCHKTARTRAFKRISPNYTMSPKQWRLDSPEILWQQGLILFQTFQGPIFPKKIIF